MQFSVDNWNEDMLLIILHSSWQSLIAIFCVGITAMFSNFVFIKILFNQEVKDAAVLMLRHRKNKTIEQNDWICEQELKNKTSWQKFVYNIKKNL